MAQVQKLCYADVEKANTDDLKLLMAWIAQELHERRKTVIK